MLKLNNQNLFNGRYFHSSVTTINGEIFIFGGSAGDNCKLNDIVVLTPDDQFKRVSVHDVDQKPCQRDFHAAAAVDDKLYVIGGSDKAGVKLQDIFEFTLPAMKPYSTTAMLQSEW